MRIAAEVASALVFLHSAPEPIIHMVSAVVCVFMLRVYAYLRCWPEALTLHVCCDIQTGSEAIEHPAEQSAHQQGALPGHAARHAALCNRPAPVCAVLLIVQQEPRQASAVAMLQGTPVCTSAS